MNENDKDIDDKDEDSNDNKVDGNSQDNFPWTEGPPPLARTISGFTDSLSFKDPCCILRSTWKLESHLFTSPSSPVLSFFVALLPCSPVPLFSVGRFSLCI